MFMFCSFTDDYDEVCQYISLESDTIVVSVGLADFQHTHFFYKSSSVLAGLIFPPVCHV